MDSHERECALAALAALLERARGSAERRELRLMYRHFLRWGRKSKAKQSKAIAPREKIPKDKKV
jgi:hypothetical protein